MSKSPGEWTEDDLLSLKRDSVEEGPDLEYKRCAALQKRDEQRREISKDVSAMANSAGGTIIYGMIEEGHVPKGLDVGFDPTDITKEWLEHVILGTIRPRLNGVVINSISLVSHAPGKVAYVVYVPQSHTAHQASNKKYYKRFNFEATAMDDYEIRDIMNRLRHPALIPQFTLHRSSSANAAGFSLETKLKNEGTVRASDFKIIVTIPQKMAGQSRGFGQRSIIIPSRIFGEAWYEYSVAKSNSVIFPSDELNLNELGAILLISIHTGNIDLNEAREPFLLWRTHANDRPPMTGKVFLSELRSV